jgi:DNA-binding transcriptional regulator YhcF (GntR family)
MARFTQFPLALQEDLQLQRESGEPIGAQLEAKLSKLVEQGRLKPGDQLPSVRQLAELAGVNVNTVRTVYGRLEQRGLLNSEHGRGTFVRGTSASAPPEDREYRRELMRQIAELERQVAYYTRHQIVGAPERPDTRPASQLLPATELMAVRDQLTDYVDQLRAIEEDRLHAISAERAAAEAEKLAERAEEVRSAGRKSRGTAATPPSIVSGPGAWVLKWRS